MNLESDSSLPSPATTPQKNNPWIIVIVLIVVVCCGCFGVAGLVFGFWEPITQALRLDLLKPLLLALS